MGIGIGGCYLFDILQLLHEFFYLLLVGLITAFILIQSYDHSIG